MALRQLLNKMNPETNRLIRAILYMIGFGGLLHLATLLIIALSKRQYAYFNPFYAVDIDQLFPGIEDSYILFVAGWAFMAAGVYIIYRILKKPS